MPRRFACGRLPLRTLSCALVGFAVACGSGEDSARDQRVADTPALDACAVLREVDLASLLGAPPDTLLTIISSASGDMAVSQCVASIETQPQTLGLMVRYSARGGNPTTRQEWIEREAEADVMGMGEEAGAAIRAAEEVPGLGDLALAYELIGPNLAVFWGNGRYQLVATSSDIANPQTARQALEAVARRALARY